VGAVRVVVLYGTVQVSLGGHQGIGDGPHRVATYRDGRWWLSCCWRASLRVSGHLRASAVANGRAASASAVPAAAGNRARTTAGCAYACTCGTRSTRAACALPAGTSGSRHNVCAAR